MKTLMKKESIKLLLVIPLLFFSLTINAQDTKSYEKAKAEIEEEFGRFPKMFEVFPDHALAGAWDNFKMLNSPESKIPPKYRELLQLAVASQIPCDYCIYYHTAAAKAHGATEEEIQEAVAHGAQTRHWSMILQGNQIDFQEFQDEFNAMMKHIASKSK